MSDARQTETPPRLEQAHPWPPGRFTEAEPQERRGAPGSRGIGDPRDRESDQPSGPREGRGQRHQPREWTGVNPLPPIDPAMPRLKPGDQGG